MQSSAREARRALGYFAEGMRGLGEGLGSGPLMVLTCRHLSSRPLRHPHGHHPTITPSLPSQPSPQTHWPGTRCRRWVTCSSIWPRGSGTRQPWMRRHGPVPSGMQVAGLTGVTHNVTRSLGSVPRLRSDDDGLRTYYVPSPGAKPMIIITSRKAHENPERKASLYRKGY